MKNRNIEGLFNFLKGLQLDLEKSSARRRFLRHIKGFKEDIELEGEEIRKEFSEKDEKGAIKVINNLIQYSKENRKKADAKFEELNNLEIPIDWTGEEKDKETIIEILEENITELKKVETFNDDSFQYVENLENIVADLKD